METKTKPELRVVSDGMPDGTHVYVGDTEISQYVTSIKWQHDGGDIPTAVVTLGLFRLTFVNPQHVRYVDANGKAIRRVEFADDAIPDLVSDD